MKFTVLMPVHNGVYLSRLKKSIFSVIESKLLPNEFLIIVDGIVSDRKKLFLKRISKKYKFIKFIFKNKMGLIKILNYGLKISKHNIIARADSDDINDKLRFKKQINFFKKNKVDILGSNIIEIINKNQKIKKMPPKPSLFNFLCYNPLNHMTVTFNKYKILKLGGYPNIKFKEDYALWFLAKKSNYKIYNLTDPLVKCYLDKHLFFRRKNIKSIISEINMFKIFISKYFLLTPFLLIIFSTRILFLLSPTFIYIFLKRNFFY